MFAAFNKFSYIMPIFAAFFRDFQYNLFHAKYS